MSVIRMLRLTKSIFILNVFAFIGNSLQDVPHLYPHSGQFSYFPHNHPIPVVAFQSGLPALYATAPPSNVVGPIVGSEVVTPASESILPEIVENRNAKDQRDHRNFIPLHRQQYLPPSPPALDERPNYESPQQSDHQYDPFNGGYIYHKPTTSTTTTTAKPQTVVVEDTPELLPPINNVPLFLPPINNDPITSELEPTHGYEYYKPSTPIIVADDTPFQQPISTPAPVYLSSAKNQLSFEQFNVPPLRLGVHEMRCLRQQTKTYGYFRAVLKIDNFLSATPTVDNDSSDKSCEVKLQKSYVVIDIAGKDFGRCGVLQCGTELCLRLRFPAIRGMRTGSDSILTLHCKTQSTVAVKTHALKMGVANDAQSRSIGTYARGGSQNPLRTHVELLRKTPQGYNRHVEVNEAVQLGEDLLLRAHVLTGDGWNYTKLTDVSLQRLSPSGEILNNIKLITSQGCLNPSMKGICTQTPSFDAPLGYKLPFKAVMFQGMKSGDDLIMSMRITACLEHHDCFINQDQCNNPNSTGLFRRKRDMYGAKQNSTEMSEISKISFKVIMPNEENYLLSSDEKDSNSLRDQTETLVLYSSLGFVGLLVGLGIFVLIKFRKS